ncbi:MAG: hypothetical protein M3261_02650, partial [Thermoproteota archaeon]|nr:hypothetical protein [Thermoproteota archaeon]
TGSVWKTLRPLRINSVVVSFTAKLLGHLSITNRGDNNWPQCIIPLEKGIDLAASEWVSCALQLEPSESGSYKVQLFVRRGKGEYLEQCFDSSEILIRYLPPVPNTIAAVAYEVENILSRFNLDMR